jgi:hypothetical protein
MDLNPQPKLSIPPYIPPYLPSLLETQKTTTYEQKITLKKNNGNNNGGEGFNGGRIKKMIGGANMIDMHYDVFTYFLNVCSSKLRSIIYEHNPHMVILASLQGIKERIHKERKANLPNVNLNLFEDIKKKLYEAHNDLYGVCAMVDDSNLEAKIEQYQTHKIMQVDSKIYKSIDQTTYKTVNIAEEDYSNTIENIIKEVREYFGEHKISEIVNGEEVISVDGFIVDKVYSEMPESPFGILWNFILEHKLHKINSTRHIITLGLIGEMIQSSTSVISSLIFIYCYNIPAYVNSKRVFLRKMKEFFYFNIDATSPRATGRAAGSKISQLITSINEYDHPHFLLSDDIMGLLSGGGGRRTLKRKRRNNRKTRKSRK